jgi:hypothetical protein
MIPRRSDAARLVAMSLPLALALAGALARPAHAQAMRATVDVGAAAAGEQIDGATPLFADAAASITWLPFAVAGRLTTAPWSPIPGGSYGALSVALSQPLGGGWFGALGVSGGTGERDALFAAARRDVEVAPTLSRGAWTVAARAGSSRLIDWERRSSRSIELLVRRDFARGWASLAAARSTFGDTATIVRDTTYVVAGFPFRGRVESQGEIDRGYDIGQLELGGIVRTAQWVARAGLPIARREGARYEPWGSVTLALPVGPRTALVAAAGRHPGVPEQRLDPSSFATVGLRFATIPLARRPSPPAVAAVAEDALATARFQVLSGSGGARLLLLTGLRGERVDINGDFTSWEPVMLERVGPDVWQRTMTIPPGAHRVVISVDGGEWRAPPGLPVSSDGFGEEAGVLYIPD